MCYIRTLLASSGSTLVHGSTTRTHAFRRPPKSRPRNSHTHTIYTYMLFDECVAPGPTQWLRPLAGLSPVSFGVTRRGQ
eukprot:scaffold7207_cov62-Phaeocystis_antarctica.AAC.5